MIGSLSDPARYREALGRARECLAGASRIVALTGAGISAESGIPTFRETRTGLWSRFDPAQLASEEGFRADPAMVWRWYAGRRDAVRKAQPNPGHAALAGGAHGGRTAVAVVTQNVDGLHVRAGSRDVVELHGNILRTTCLERCGRHYEPEDLLPAGEPPTCPSCGAPLRPDVVWFGEMLDPARLARAEELAHACDAMLVVGTSGLVYPAAALPAYARGRGARVIVVNPDETELDGIADVCLRGAAGNVLPALLGRS
jgi:NAD-dependent deacetylase